MVDMVDDSHAKLAADMRAAKNPRYWYSDIADSTLDEWAARVEQLGLAVAKEMGGPTEGKNPLRADELSGSWPTKSQMGDDSKKILATLRTGWSTGPINVPSHENWAGLLEQDFRLFAIANDSLAEGCKRRDEELNALQSERAAREAELGRIEEKKARLVAGVEAEIAFIEREEWEEWAFSGDGAALADMLMGLRRRLHALVESASKKEDA